jgi:hypothetical protein
MPSYNNIGTKPMTEYYYQGFLIKKKELPASRWSASAMVNGHPIFENKKDPRIASKYLEERLDRILELL